MLNQTLTKQFLDVLMQLPITETYRGRSQLLQGLPQVSIPRDEGNRRLDLSLMVRHIDQLGRLKDTGIRPVMVIARNAYDTLEGWQGELSGRLEEVMQQLESYYAGEMTVSKPQFALAIEPEKLLFRNRDYRVSLNFLQRAIQAARSVARLQVFVCQHGERTERAYFGTGWLIAPGLLVTNYHVIEAREAEEPPASQHDLHLQAAHLAAWFDYYHERIDGSQVRCQGTELVYAHPELDYALLRLREQEKVADRRPLAQVKQKPNLDVGYHLNVIQYPGGGTLKFALRNTFYVGTRPDDPSWLHYLSDTEPGSSGSPVLNDAWEVVAVHHAAFPVKPYSYDMRMQGLSQHEPISYHNEGVALIPLLESLPPDLKREVVGAGQASV